MELERSDDVLFAAVREGDEHAFEILFKLHYSNLCRSSMAVVQEEMVAEEIVSDFLLKVWRNRTQIEIKTSIKGYFNASVRNLSLNYLKGKKQALKEINDVDLHLESNEESPLEAMISEEVSMEWEEKINKLPAQRQKVFRMNKLEGKPLSEIAKELSLSELTVRNHIHLAIRSLATMSKLLVGSIFTLL